MCLNKNYWKDVKIEWIEFFKKISVDKEINSLINLIDWSKNNIFPNKENLLNIFKLIKPQDVNVVILGQDPYPTRGYANGIAFAVNQNCKTPKSLQNIFKVIKNDLNQNCVDKTLISWVKQGVLLINTIFSVEENKPLSHENLGWQNIVCKILSNLNQINLQIIYCLLGKKAQSFYNNVVNKTKYILKTSHPSPLGVNYGFKESKVFVSINNILKTQNKKPIIWGENNKYME